MLRMADSDNEKHQPAAPGEKFFLVLIYGY